MMKSRKHNGIQDMRTAVKLAVKLPANVCQFTYRTPHNGGYSVTHKKNHLVSLKTPLLMQLGQTF